MGVGEESIVGVCVVFIVSVTSKTYIFCVWFIYGLKGTGKGSRVIIDFRRVFWKRFLFIGLERVS